MATKTVKETTGSSKPTASSRSASAGTIREGKAETAGLNASSTSCCNGSSSCTTTSIQTTKSSPSKLSEKKGEAKKGPKTRIIVKYDIGFNNQITLRGKGANLSWDKGVVLKNVKPDEWIWESDLPFTTCEFKVLINDMHYELGDNHPLSCGASIQYTPRF